MKNQSVHKLVLAALFLALCMVLPFLTGQIPTIGVMLSPMHIPVLLCGFICGWQYGAAVGFIAPLLRGVTFGMPVLMPNGISMAFELLTYGLVTGIMYVKLPKKRAMIYVSLVTAMLLGRAVWGVTRLILTGVSGSSFTYTMFIAGALANVWPAIIIQLLLVPMIVMALHKANLMPTDRSVRPKHN